MKKLLLALLLLPTLVQAQSIVNGWTMNVGGKKGSYYLNNGGQPVTYTWTVSNDSADALRVAYNNDSVWIRSQGLTDNMGKWLNPGGATAQNYVHRLPRNPTVPATKTVAPKQGAIGLLLNGIPIYGLTNAASWTGTTNANPQAGGQGVWNVEVGLSEGFVLDTAFGAHPQQAGAYHTHATPYRLYKNTPSTQHSPLIGFAFDGYPVYGPYGYVTATNSASGVTRMKTGYSLRNISTRTTMPTIPNGGGAASQTGPAVSQTYPLGTYVEDYEWLAANGGDLDQYNGRYCVTPEYPGGTYAYFITISAAGATVFPHIIGVYYYGAPVTANYPIGQGSNGLSIPASGVQYINPVALALRVLHFSGSMRGESAHLQLSVNKAEELAGAYVQRSTDGAMFEDWRRVETGAGAEGSKVFSIVDDAPLGLTYYRAKLVEHSGVETFSAVVVLRSAVDAGTWTIYPTVTDGMLHVQGPASEEHPHFIITDMTGQLVRAGQLSNSAVDVASLAPGSYLFSVAGSAHTTLRFFKR
jgi:hypothetical protein